jgi:hypothetical protein
MVFSHTVFVVETISLLLVLMMAQGRTKTLSQKKVVNIVLNLISSRIVDNTKDIPMGDRYHFLVDWSE